MRAELKKTARMLPMRLYTESGLQGDVSSEGCDVPHTITQTLTASMQRQDESVAILTSSIPLSQSNSLLVPNDAAKCDVEDGDDKTPPTETNEPNAQQQVPPLQDYCALRVFVSWPPPPADCDVSLQRSW